MRERLTEERRGQEEDNAEEDSKEEGGGDVRSTGKDISSSAIGDSKPMATFFNADWFCFANPQECKTSVLPL